MSDLEQQLTELAPAIAWPSTPQIRVVIPIPLATVAALRRPPRAVPRWALAAAAVVLIAAIALAYTPTREVIAGWLNLHTIINRVQQLQTPSPQPAGPLGQRLGLGKPTSLGNAQGQVSWRIAVPSELGQPDEVYLQVPPQGASGGEVTLVYKSRPDIKPSGYTGVAVLVTEARGKVNEALFQKTIGPGTTLDVVTVNGHSGWWIEGSPHDFAFIDANGNTQFETLRLATNTLILDDNGTIVRIEGDMTRAQALRIAGSL
jgi:hypothetical protein